MFDAASKTLPGKAAGCRVDDFTHLKDFGHSIEDCTRGVEIVMCSYWWAAVFRSLMPSPFHAH